ncbi:aminodeoxychorismate lyase [Bacillus salipaludis]|uniref:aminodeoxychorismate lyase n=1 Tax=Bacillus salipaludis TaxID=2547811 RepID=UPI002E23711C|nr:aminodeoxychorismate lyase [Bacillus salipaludis]
MFIYVNGEIVKKEEASISPFDHGFLYGMGLFETFRIYHGHPFLLDNHIARLNEGLEVLNIEKRFTRDEVCNALRVLLDANELINAYIRFNVSAGLGEVGLQVEPYREPSVLIFAKPLPEAGEMAEKKASLLQLKRNTPEGLTRLKSHHYMNNLLAKREIGSSTDVEGIFLTAEGYIAEGIVSNIFWKKGNTVYTPSLGTGILNGITRQFTIKAVKTLGLHLEEGLFGMEDITAAEEIFVTNSIQEIVPIAEFEGHAMPGKSGAIVQKLHQHYRESCNTLWSI